MRRAKALVPLALGLNLLTAGCVDPAPDEGTPGAPAEDEVATITFEGSSPGTTRSESATCDDDAGITAGGNVDRGVLWVRVHDGDGKVVHRENLSGDVDLEVDGIKGVPGVWTLETRQLVNASAGRFEGTYSVVLAC